MEKDKWTGLLIGRMHNEEVTYAELGAEMGISEAYVSMILNGKRKPNGMQSRMESAFDAIIERRKEEEQEGGRESVLQKMIYPNLEAEMARAGYDRKDIARVLNVHLSSAYRLLDGTSTLSISRAKTIRDALFPEQRIDYLFNTQPQSVIVK